MTIGQTSMIFSEIQFQDENIINVESTKDTLKKLEARKRLCDVHLPKWFQFLEDLLIENRE